MVFPDRPTGNAWQLIGNSFNQGAGIVNDLATSQNAMQALVERRTQAALEQKRLEHEQAARDWEFQQKQDDDAKKQAFVDQAIALSSKGFKNPDISTTTPASTRDIGFPSSDVAIQKPTSIGGMAAPQLGYKPAPIPQIQTPEQTITTPGGYRPAIPQDYKDLAIRTGNASPELFTKPSPYEEAYAQAAGKLAGSIPKAGATPAYVTLAAQYKASNPLASQADIISSVAQQYPESVYDKSFLNSLIKTSDKGAAIENAGSGAIKANSAATNAETAQGRLDAQKIRDAANALKDVSTNPNGIGNKELNHIIADQKGLQNAYNKETNSQRNGVALGKADMAYKSVNGILNKPNISPIDLLAVKDQVIGLLNPGYAINRTQFEHLNAGGLVDKVQNWYSPLNHSDKSLDPVQVAQFKDLISRVGNELSDAHATIKDSYWQQAHDISQKRGLIGTPDSVFLSSRNYSFDKPKESVNPTIPGVSTTEPGSNTGNKKQKWGVDANGMPVPLEN